MLNSGSLSGANWGENDSMARSIENEMVADELVDLAQETEDAAKQRRKTFIAISRGIINYIKANMDITIAPNAIDPNIPTVSRTLSGKVS